VPGKFVSRCSWANTVRQKTRATYISLLRVSLFIRSEHGTADRPSGLPRGIRAFEAESKQSARGDAQTVAEKSHTGKIVYYGVR